MEWRTAQSRLSVTTSEKSDTAFKFAGFKAPTANTTYTPNQFFDVVVPHFPRGVVRIVAFLLRKTLGWCDSSGNPQEEQIEVSYSELERKAGVSRDMIRGALDEALAGRMIECAREGRPRMAHDAGQSALYSLRWCDAPYTTRPAEFRGFFEGEGNRTDIPNEFFDVVVPREPLSVIKVVASIIRHSIGFQAKHGKRRQQVALSYQQIQNYARFGSRSDLAKALRIAQQRQYIIRLEDGVFSPYGHERKAATYALRWADYLVGQKIEPVRNRSENQTSDGQISAPVVQSEIRTSIKTKPEKETVNSRAANLESVEKLKAAGFTEAAAEELAGRYSPEAIERQVTWLPHRGPRRPLAMLRKALENDWPAPAGLRISELTGTPGFEFARHFYAAFGGNRGEPVNEPSPRDAEMAAAFVQRLLAVAGRECITDWASALAGLARGQRSPFPSLQLAIRQLGDKLLSEIERDRRAAAAAEAEARRAAREESLRPIWRAWLEAELERIRREQPEALVQFTTQREEQRRRLSASPHPWDRKAASLFDTESSQLTAARQFFGLPDLQSWDATINSQSF